MIVPSRLGRLARRLRRSDRAIAMTEFALATPLVMALGMYGLESANLALTNLRVSQAASNLADTTSRVGEASALALKKIRESDINDAFQAVRLQSGSSAITTQGRVILSSLERNVDGGQWIHWQRCIGLKNVASSYGTAGDGVSGTGFAGMGPAGQKIEAPANSAVMFVEIIYDYKPLISETLFGPKVIRAHSAFLVRDQRDLSEGNNPSNPAPAAPVAACNLFAA